MRKQNASRVTLALLLCLAAPAWAQPAPEKEADQSPRFSAPPERFDVRREGQERGKLERVDYDSKTVGAKRWLQVYTPPGYSQDKKYPALYLLHGIGGNEREEWTRQGVAHVVLDNLIADKQIEPLIVVFPNGNATATPAAPGRGGPGGRRGGGFGSWGTPFENDLLKDIIPFIEANYSVKAERESRAVAGLSMGGGQALNIGLTNLDTFAWVGGFSSAPNTRQPAELIKDHVESAKKLKLLYIACGDADGLLRISQGLHSMLDEKQVPHRFNVILGGRHDFQVWKSDLYHFAQLLFREPAEKTPVASAKSPAGLRIFYTGHSFHMFVPQHVNVLVKAAGIEGHLEVGKQGIGGSRVIQHWEKADDQNSAKKALLTGKVDVFTMAAHVAIPDEGITNFTELGLAHNPNLRLLVQASWFPYDVPELDKRVRSDALDQRDSAKIADLQKAVDDWRKLLEAQADDLNQKHGKTCVYIVPVGDAVVKLRGLIADGKYPGITKQSILFTDAIGHGTPPVQALASYCNYVAIYRHNPMGMKVPAIPETKDIAGKKDAPGVNDQQHAILQKIAWETVSEYPYAGIAARAAAAP